MQSSISAEPPAGLQSIDITFEPRGDKLIGLGFVNGILKVLTLGLYSFWGKTEVRRRLWSFTRLNGEPLEYTGTGKELFFGFLVVFFLYILPLTLGGVGIILFFGSNQFALGLYYAAAYILFFLLIGNAMYRATRYRLSRTRWRGIRGDLVGSPGRYGWTYFWTLALPAALALGAASLSFNPASLEAVRFLGPAGVFASLSDSKFALASLAVGAAAIMLILPWRSNLLQRQLTNGMQFGSAPLSYNGRAGPLYKRYLLAGFGALALIAAAIASTAAMTYADIAPETEFEPTGTPLTTKLLIFGIWFSLLVALAVITAWYRANQFNHFAKHTHFGGATFRAGAAGPGLAWLAFSNWLLVFLATLAGALLGAGIIVGFFATNVIQPPTFAPGGKPELPPAANLAILLPIVMTTSAATTFAQFRNARYFLSRLKLDGKLDLDQIQQTASTGPRRGEGLAQVFDLDAF